MGTRTEDLTAAAKPVAERLAKRLGHLKVALSAGIIALDHLDASDREAMVGMANDAAEDAIDLYAEQRALAGLQNMVRDYQTLLSLQPNELAQKICREAQKWIDAGMSEHRLPLTMAQSDEEKEKVLGEILRNAGPELMRKIPQMVQEATRAAGAVQGALSNTPPGTHRKRRKSQAGGAR